MQGLQLVRHISKLGDKDKQQAEVRLVAHAAAGWHAHFWALAQTSLPALVITGP
jgi:hypothetical protein